MSKGRCIEVCNGHPVRTCTPVIVSWGKPQTLRVETVNTTVRNVMLCH